MTMQTPQIFISYSHDSLDHKAWVLKLATDLRSNGVDASLDQWDLVPGQDVAVFMQKGILKADRVILICSDKYVKKAEEGVGGVGFERLIVTSEVVQNLDTRKFIPLVRSNPSDVKIPRFLGPRLYIDFSGEENYAEKLEDLLREVLGAPANQKPALGTNPFSAELPSEGAAPRHVSSTGVTQSGRQLLREPWYEAERTAAEGGLANLGLIGLMEVRTGLHEQIAKSQLDLLNAVRKSQVRFFGWPIGVVLENKEEYKPKPLGDGIRAEVSINKDTVSGRQTYDYWATRMNGDFYLLQSLFEDTREKDRLYFNTRIIRVTEAIMFATSLYLNLGVPPEASYSMRVSHRGLKGRVLTSAGGNRHVFPSVSHESVSDSEIVIEIGKSSELMVDYVRRLVEPMFMLFDFQEFHEEIYTDIVRRYEKGQVS
jgi:hypothetical protein